MWTLHLWHAVVVVRHASSIAVATNMLCVPIAGGKQTAVIVLAVLLIVAVCVAIFFGALFFW